MEASSRWQLLISIETLEDRTPLDPDKDQRRICNKSNKNETEDKSSAAQDSNDSSLNSSIVDKMTIHKTY